MDSEDKYIKKLYNILYSNPNKLFYMKIILEDESLSDEDVMKLISQSSLKLRHILKFDDEKINVTAEGTGSNFLNLIDNKVVNSIYPVKTMQI
ncbi:Hypothetical protein ORPV_337 [Orpheovirus IHUMI-LCC2]|uniref:Uncharacterized protein n=1 Tax=Orpheovirus IHUMI-LCC2 TaxID=2023057 RepID=A0A2I2L405_9VIRU|nr:Hypothetical protein ORPV_337 [Orpheovirus IHUMI-LCC2]SNW62241.1 Hypothetical protein ORPV_337 [Orpheovirus IHUMI-LCC2]